MDQLRIRLEELQMIWYSLLPGETLDFVEDSRFWKTLLENETISSSEAFALDPRSSSVTYSLKVQAAPVWFQVTMRMYPSATIQAGPFVSVKGSELTRAEQEHWQQIVDERVERVHDSELKTYDLVSQHLLPLLHDAKMQSTNQESHSLSAQQTLIEPKDYYHVLFISHHLMSPKKRRSLQQWTSSLGLNGFAKVGYPGVIYAHGSRENIEEFVSNVKAMQWLALKVRFVEPVRGDQPRDTVQERTWGEFQKVGEVVEEMRKIGREEYIIEMGIGSVGAN